MAHLSNRVVVSWAGRGSQGVSAQKRWAMWGACVSAVLRAPCERACRDARSAPGCGACPCGFGHGKVCGGRWAYPRGAGRTPSFSRSHVRVRDISCIARWMRALPSSAVATAIIYGRFSMELQHTWALHLAVDGSRRFTWAGMCTRFDHTRFDRWRAPSGSAGRGEWWRLSLAMLSRSVACAGRGFARCIAMRNFVTRVHAAHTDHIVL